MTGRGGQGIVTCARILSIAAGIYESKFVKILPVFGHEKRGALVYCDVIIDSSPILLNSHIKNPDLLIEFEPYLYKDDYYLSINKDVILLVNSGEDNLDKYVNCYNFKNIYYLKAEEIARNYDVIMNVPLLCSLVAIHVINKSSIEKVLREYSNGIIDKDKINECINSTCKNVKKL